LVGRFAADASGVPDQSAKHGRSGHRPPPHQWIFDRSGLRNNEFSNTMITLLLYFFHDWLLNTHRYYANGAEVNPNLLWIDSDRPAPNIQQRGSSAHRGAPARDCVRFRSQLLAHWDNERVNFWQLCPKEMIGRLAQPLSETKQAAE
jgi:hypothetical protein